MVPTLWHNKAEGGSKKSKGSNLLNASPAKKKKLVEKQGRIDSQTPLDKLRNSAEQLIFVDHYNQQNHAESRKKTQGGKQVILAQSSTTANNFYPKHHQYYRDQRCNSSTVDMHDRVPHRSKDFGRITGSLFASPVDDQPQSMPMDQKNVSQQAFTLQKPSNPAQPSLTPNTVN